LEQWVEQSEAARQAARERGEEEVILPFGQGDYGHSFSIEKALSSLSEKELFKRTTCSLCSDLPEKALKTDVGVSLSLLIECGSLGLGRRLLIDE